MACLKLAETVDPPPCRPPFHATLLCCKPIRSVLRTGRPGFVKVVQKSGSTNLLMIIHVDLFPPHSLLSVVVLNPDSGRDKTVMKGSLGATRRMRGPCASIPVPPYRTPPRRTTHSYIGTRTGRVQFTMQRLVGLGRPAVAVAAPFSTEGAHQQPNMAATWNL